MAIMKNLVYIFLVEYFKFWAKIRLFFWRPTIIGFTGSMGKTSFLYILDSIFTAANLNHKSSFKANSEIGLPLNILNLPAPSSPFVWLKNLSLAPLKIIPFQKPNFYLAEMAIDSTRYPKNMDFLLSIFVPDIAVGLDVSLMHSLQINQETGFNNEDQILSTIAFHKAKLLITTLKKGGWVIYNHDNSYLTTQIQSFLALNPQYQSKTLSVSLTNPKSDIYVQTQLKNQTFIVQFTYANQNYTFTVPHLALFPEYGRLIASAAVIALKHHVTPAQIQQGLHNLKLPGRFSVFEGIKNTIILDSSYNAPYQAMIKMINHFYHLFPSHPKILVLGEMRELGPLSHKKHQELAQMIAKLDFKHLFVVGDQMKKVFLPFLLKVNPKLKHHVTHFDSSQKLGRHLANFIKGGEAIFIKGSQNTIFLEEAIKPLLKNRSDIKYLVRQSPDWIKRKHKFFAPHANQ